MIKLHSSYKRVTVEFMLLDSNDIDQTLQQKYENSISCQTPGASTFDFRKERETHLPDIYTRF